MAEGRSRQLWEIGSHIMAVIVNSMRWDSKAKPIQPRQFNPHAEVRPTKPVSKAEKKLGFDMLRAAFCPKEATNGRR